MPISVPPLNGPLFPNSSFSCRELQVLALAVARQALADELLAERVVVGALLAARCRRCRRRRSCAGR